MQKYNQLSELIEAYVKFYNDDYPDQPWKHFSPRNVKSVCVFKMTRSFAFHDGVMDTAEWEKNWTYAIRKFGYVAA